MAQNNRREIELALSVTTANADALSKLQQDVRSLAKEGGDAAPAFQKLADELAQLAEQAKQLTALEGLIMLSEQHKLFAMNWFQNQCFGSLLTPVLKVTVLLSFSNDFLITTWENFGYYISNLLAIS